MQFVATDDEGAGIASAERLCVADEVLAELTVPAHAWIRVGAVTFDAAEAGDGAVVHQVRTKLGPGERQIVVLECTGIVTQLRLVGPSARLLPHLKVALQPAPLAPDVAAAQQRAATGRAPSQHRFIVHPDADGTMRCHLPAEPVRAAVLMSEGADVLLTGTGGAIDLGQRGGDVELAPAEPLLGIVVEQHGAAVPSTLSLSKPLYRHLPSPCEVTTRRLADAAVFVHGWIDELGPFRVPIDAVRRDGDLWVVDPRPDHRLGQLVVTVGEQPVPSSQLQLVAALLGDGPAQKLWRASGTLRASLPAGDYRLDWELNGGRGPVAAAFVRIAGGSTTTLQLAPLAQERWEVHLQLPSECKHAATLRLGGIHALGAAQDGVLPIDLTAPPRLGDRGQLILFSLGATFDATVSAVDPSRRRVEVSSRLTEAEWTRIAAPPMAGGRIDIQLLPDPDSGATLPAALGQEALVPLLTGQPRDGCVIEKVDGQDQLVRWFRVQAGQHELALTGQGRWTTLAIERPFVRATILVAGPGTSDPLKVRDVTGAGPHRLFVAEATREVHVDLQPGGRCTFDAVLGAFVVR